MSQIAVVVLYFAYFRIVVGRKHRTTISTPDIVRIIGVLDGMKLKFLEKDVGCGEFFCFCCFICGLFEVVIVKHERTFILITKRRGLHMVQSAGSNQIQIDVPWIRCFSLQSSSLLCVVDNFVNAV